MNETDLLYCCYSKNLRDFFYKNGVKYQIQALNVNNQKIFWIYIKTDKVKQLLDEWTHNK